MAAPAPDDSGLFQWIIGGIATGFVAAIGFVMKRVDTIDKRTNDRIDRASEEARKDTSAGDDRLWQAINANRTAAEQRHSEILTTMATKDDVREVGRRIEALISRAGP